MNDPSVPLWIIANREGAILSAHCRGCMAGLGECCSHVASVLFYLEIFNRIRGKISCTQMKSYWLLPSFIKDISFAEVRNINFKSAKKLKNDLDQTVDNLDATHAFEPLGTTCLRFCSCNRTEFLLIRACRLRVNTGVRRAISGYRSFCNTLKNFLDRLTRLRDPLTFLGNLFFKYFLFTLSTLGSTISPFSDFFRISTQLVVAQVLRLHNPR